VLANADFEISKIEMKKIESKMKKHITNNEDFHLIFDEAHDLFETQNDATVADFILHQASRLFANKTEIDLMISNLKELAFADNNESNEETLTLLNIKKILFSVC
jgi:hypothetical protein